jgi:hypothetical protein
VDRRVTTPLTPRPAERRRSAAPPYAALPAYTPPAAKLGQLSAARAHADLVAIPPPGALHQGLAAPSPLYAAAPHARLQTNPWGDEDDAGGTAPLSELERGASAGGDETDDSHDSDDDSESSERSSEYGGGGGHSQGGPRPMIQFSCRSSARDGADTEFEVTSDSSSLCSVSGAAPLDPSRYL